MHSDRGLACPADGSSADEALSSCARRLIDAVASIRDEQPDQVQFQHSALCQVGLPRRFTAARTFERRSGHMSILVEAGKLFDGREFVERPMPYGSVPRLIMVYLSTEAVRTRHRIIEVGDSLRQFLLKLGLRPNGGARGGYGVCKAQLESLSAARITLGMYRDGRAVTIDAKPIERFEAWPFTQAGTRVLWPGVMELSERFFSTLAEHAVPLDPRALAALKHSSLALDIYAWLTQRLCRVRTPAGVKLSWMNLRNQFGQEYLSSKDFKREFRHAIRQALAVYPDARVAEVMGGITLYPSPAPIRQMRAFVSHQHGAQSALSA